jgi:hypothetical protein
MMSVALSAKPVVKADPSMAERLSVDVHPLRPAPRPTDHIAIGP